MTAERPTTTLLLGGPMGAGKTTLGRALAARVGVRFVDLDEALVARAGRSIAEIFAERGESGFRALEAEELARVLDAPGPLVVALGGGSLVDPATRRDALSRARVVNLVARTSTLADRTAGPGRPLLDGSGNREARLQTLISTRTAAYAEAHGKISTDGVPLDGALDAVQAAWTDPAIVVPLGARSYAVRIAREPARAAGEAVAALHPSAAFIVSDTTVAPLWGATLREAFAQRGVPIGAVKLLPPGEEQKTLATAEEVLRSFVEAGADRDAVVVAHGGGVVSDIAGFVAATLFRGVRWVSVPTTLLAMVDASVGGKTGVDLGPAKNAVGAFHQPSGVVTGPSYVTTELERDYVSGLAEAVKAAAIGDAALFEAMERSIAPLLAREEGAVREVVHRAVAVKAGIVSRDEREDGERALLNFGHTLGHALEACAGYGRRTHGECVALGMVAMARVGRALGKTDEASAERLERLLARLRLPTTLGSEPLGDAIALLRLDKKRRGDRVRVVMVPTIGSAVVEPMPLDQLAQLLGSLA